MSWEGKVEQYLKKNDWGTKWDTTLVDNGFEAAKVSTIHKKNSCTVRHMLISVLERIISKTDNSVICYTVV